MPAVFFQTVPVCPVFEKKLLREGQFSLKYPFIYLIIRHKCGIVNNNWKKGKKHSQLVLLHKADEGFAAKKMFFVTTE